VWRRCGDGVDSSTSDSESETTQRQCWKTEVAILFVLGRSVLHGEEKPSNDKSSPTNRRFFLVVFLVVSCCSLSQEGESRLALCCFSQEGESRVALRRANDSLCLASRRDRISMSNCNIVESSHRRFIIEVLRWRGISGVLIILLKRKNDAALLIDSSVFTLSCN
jgi:hypothetical protein